MIVFIKKHIKENFLSLTFSFKENKLFKAIINKEVNEVYSDKTLVIHFLYFRLYKVIKTSLPF